MRTIKYRKPATKRDRVAPAPPKASELGSRLSQAEDHLARVRGQVVKSADAAIPEVQAKVDAHLAELSFLSDVRERASK